jgi:hypothetical protein
MEPRYDGFVSRHLNRRISDPIARLLAKTWLTPNQASLGAGVVAGLSFASFVLGYCRRSGRRAGPPEKDGLPIWWVHGCCAGPIC